MAEERFAIVVPTLFDSIGRIIKAVDKKFGAEGRNLLSQVSLKKGLEMGEMMKPQCPGEDFNSVGTFFAGALQNFGVDCEAEVKEDEVVIKAPKCPYGLEGTNRELCEAMMDLDVGIIETLGPDVTLDFDKTVAVGNPYCELSIKPRT